MAVNHIFLARYRIPPPPLPPNGEIIPQSNFPNAARLEIYLEGTGPGPTALNTYISQITTPNQIPAPDYFTNMNLEELGVNLVQDTLQTPEGGLSTFEARIPIPSWLQQAPQALKNYKARWKGLIETYYTYKKNNGTLGWKFFPKDELKKNLQEHLKTLLSLASQEAQKEKEGICPLPPEISRFYQSVFPPSKKTSPGTLIFEKAGDFLKDRKKTPLKDKGADFLFDDFLEFLDDLQKGKIVLLPTIDPRTGTQLQGNELFWYHYQLFLFEKQALIHSPQGTAPQASGQTDGKGAKSSFTNRDLDPGSLPFWEEEIRAVIKESQRALTRTEREENLAEAGKLIDFAESSLKQQLKGLSGEEAAKKNKEIEDHIHILRSAIKNIGAIMNLFHKISEKTDQARGATTSAKRNGLLNEAHELLNQCDKLIQELKGLDGGLLRNEYDLNLERHRIVSLMPPPAMMEGLESALNKLLDTSLDKLPQALEDFKRELKEFEDKLTQNGRRDLTEVEVRILNFYKEILRIETTVVSDEAYQVLPLADKLQILSRRAKNFQQRALHLNRRAHGRPLSATETEIILNQKIELLKEAYAIIAEVKKCLRQILDDLDPSNPDRDILEIFVQLRIFMQIIFDFENTVRINFNFPPLNLMLSSYLQNLHSELYHGLFSFLDTLFNNVRILKETPSSAMKQFDDYLNEPSVKKYIKNLRYLLNNQPFDLPGLTDSFPVEFHPLLGYLENLVEGMENRSLALSASNPDLNRMIVFRTIPPLSPPEDLDESEADDTLSDHDELNWGELLPDPSLTPRPPIDPNDLVLRVIASVFNWDIHVIALETGGQELRIFITAEPSMSQAAPYVRAVRSTPPPIPTAMPPPDDEVFSDQDRNVLEALANPDVIARICEQLGIPIPRGVLEALANKQNSNKK